MSDCNTSYDDDMYDNFSIMTPSPDPLVGEDMTDINMEDIERNSPVVIPPTQEQQQQQLQQQTPSTVQEEVVNRQKTILKP